MKTAMTAHTNSLLGIFVIAATMAATISPILATSPSSYSLSNMASNMAAHKATSLSRLITDIKSVRLIHNCREFVQQFKNAQPSSSSSSNKLQHLSKVDIRDVVKNSYTETRIPHFLRHNEIENNANVDSMLDFKFPTTTEFPLYQNDALTGGKSLPFGYHFARESSHEKNNNKFPVFQRQDEVKIEKNHFQFMEQMCLKYAFDKLLQTQQKERRRVDSSSDNFMHNNHFNPSERSIPESVASKIGDEGYILDSNNPHRLSRSRPAYNDGFNTRFNSNNNLPRSSSSPSSQSTSFRRQEMSDNDQQSSDDSSPITPSKRGYSSFANWMRQVRAKRRHRISINNALMTLTNSLVEDRQQRVKQNRNNMMYHMYLQG